MWSWGRGGQGTGVRRHTADAHELCAWSERSGGVAARGAEIAGFWLGLWHGIITPITFVISLFSDTVNMYEIHNNGNWYNFGFVLGAGVLLGGGGAGSRGRRG